MNKIYAFFVFAVLLASPLLPMPVSAQSGIGVSVEPKSVVLQTQPGSQTSTTFVVTNIGSFTSSTRPSIEYLDFKPGEDGQPVIVAEGEDYKFGASTWLNGTLGLANLGAGQTNDVDVFIDVPAGTEPGAYSALVLVRTSTSGANSADFDSLVGVLLIINVGQSEPGIEIVIGDRTFVDEATGEVSVELKNTSNHYFKPLVGGAVSIASDSGFSFKTISFDEGGVFPGTNRIFKTSLEDAGIDMTEGERAYNITVSNDGKVLASEDIFTSGTGEEAAEEVVESSDDESPASSVDSSDDSPTVAPTSTSSVLPYVAIGGGVLLLATVAVGFFIYRGRKTKPLPAPENPLFQPEAASIPEPVPDDPVVVGPMPGIVPPPKHEPPKVDVSSVPAMPETPAASQPEVASPEQPQSRE